jgi:hypothetical protein
MSDENSVERRGAQALLATFVQMTQHAELARELQRARLRATARRMGAAAEPGEVARLRQQLDAQQNQEVAIGRAVQRFHRRAPQLASFAEAGLTFEDYRQLGLDQVVNQEAVEDARRRGAEARGKSAPETPAPKDSDPG